MSTNKAFTFIPHGAILKEFKVCSQNIVLGFSDPEEYKNNPSYFGATIGRVANRIANAKFTLNNGTTYELAKNNGPNSLHGGFVGWDQKEWVHERSEEVELGEGKVCGWRDVFCLVSEDGDQGFPGKVRCVLKYTQWKEKCAEVVGGEKEVLEMDFGVELVGEGVEETVINLTNHSYFNLTGDANTAGTTLTVPTTTYLPVDSTSIPLYPSTNTVYPYPGLTPYPGITPKEPFTLGPTSPAIDHCFLLNCQPSTILLDTRTLPLQTCVSAFHPKSKIWLEVLTTEPAFQLYTGEFIDVTARKDGSGKKAARAGFCVEPSRYVDAVNRDQWRGMVVLKKGKVYGSKIVYKAWKEE
ncbi:aldose 1-epimerase [Tirmania nivea]|nr:aldose 1-epimerase [Tirmania nivea]